MKLPNFTAHVSIDVEGDITKSRWIGTFNIKRVLSHSDRFNIDTYYKQYLPDDSSSSESIKLRASTLAELKVRVLDGPPWWEGTNYGMDMVDTSPMYKLLTECANSYSLWEKELSDAVQNKPKLEGQGNAG